MRDEYITLSQQLARVKKQGHNAINASVIAKPRAVESYVYEVNGLLEMLVEQTLDVTEQLARLQNG